MRAGNRLPAAIAFGVAIATGLGLPACTLGPDYVRPVPDDLPARHLDTSPAGAAIADSGADSAAGPGADPAATAFGATDWRQVYTDPPLVRLIETALTRNLDLRQALARVEQARAAAGASGLVLLPQLGLEVDRTRNKQSAQAVPFAGIQRDLTVNRVSLAASWELDLWGRVRRSAEAANADWRASEDLARGVAVSLIGEVAAAYVDLQMLDRQRDIASRSIAARERFVELTTARARAGTASGLEVATAEAQAATSRATVHDLERQIRLAEDRLSLLTGGWPGVVARSGNAALVVATPPAGLPSALLDRRPDLRAAEARLVAANARVGVAKAALFPRISLTGSFGTASQQLGDLFSVPSNLFSFGANLAQPLLDAERNLFALDAADAARREALLAYEASIKAAFREVADALAERSRYAEQVQQRTAAVEALARASDIARARYRVGYSSYFEVIAADAARFDAELAAAAAEGETRRATIRLYRALGGGWDAADAALARDGG